MTTKPNIIFILTDDQGYGDVSRHGNPILQTPHMDKLHDESVRFEDFCVSPSCSPSRCAIMTGRHEFKGGVTHTIMGRNRMSLESTTLAQVLKSAGYATGIFGKWHLGHDGDYRPENRGFDESLTTIEDTQRSHFDPVLLRNGVEEQHEGYRTEILFDNAINFIEECSSRHSTLDTRHSQPFFCYLPTYSPHAPHIVPQAYMEKYKDTVSEREAAFLGMVACIDDNVGRLMAALKEFGLEENTVVILINDNGATAGVDLFNAGMRGCKGTPWFGGRRALSFWRWKGTFEPRAVAGLASHMDVLPTLAELADADLKQEYRESLDGISLAPQLTSDAPLPDRMIFTHQGRWPTGEAARHKFAQCSVRWKNYDLVRNDVCDDPECKGECRVFRKAMTGATQVAYSFAKGQFHYAVTEGHWRLFDTFTDPSQENDLSAGLPEVVETMTKNYDEWWNDMVPLIKEIS